MMKESLKTEVEEPTPYPLAIALRKVGRSQYCALLGHQPNSAAQRRLHFCSPAWQLIITRLPYITHKTMRVSKLYSAACTSLAMHLR